jgi:2-iminobutanoate/2-iminopropanoate deaminase
MRPDDIAFLSPPGAIRPTGSWGLGVRAGDFVFVAGMRGIDPARLVVYFTVMDRYRPLVNKIQEEFWGAPPYPPRTIVEVSRLNQDDIVEVEGTFFCPPRKPPTKENVDRMVD